METKKLVLDISKWRCGFNSIKPENHIGKGETSLMNSEGFMCCLGQFALQLGFTEDDIFLRTEPEDIDLNDPIELLTRIYINVDEEEDIVNSNFSIEAITINDEENTTVKEKVNRLTELCFINDIELEIMNEELIPN